jgi:hypothetical protein
MTSSANVVSFNKIGFPRRRCRRRSSCPEILSPDDFAGTAWRTRAPLNAMRTANRRALTWTPNSQIGFALNHIANFNAAMVQMNLHRFWAETLRAARAYADPKRLLRHGFKSTRSTTRTASSRRFSAASAIETHVRRIRRGERLSSATPSSS